MLCSSTAPHGPIRVHRSEESNLALFPLLAATCFSRPPADNVFTGTKEIEFFDAQQTKWEGNILPEDGVCVKLVTSDKGIDIDESTFAVSDGLPSEEC